MKSADENKKERLRRKPSGFLIILNRMATFNYKLQITNNKIKN